MEAISMINTNTIEAAATQNEMYFICHSCVGRMIQARTVHPDRYKGIQLRLQNLPYWQCTECDDAMYGASTLMKHLKRARERYDTTGETVYDCL
jgi:YgiT-type zinc finger domain-containing protein